MNEALIHNVQKMAHKVEIGATENLVKGETDRVIHLVNARQLARLINELKTNHNDRTAESNGASEDFDYPNW